MLTKPPLEVIIIQKRCALSVIDNKRYILPDLVSTIDSGHVLLVLYCSNQTHCPTLCPISTPVEFNDQL